MRDNSERLPEIVKATSIDGNYFLIVKVKINDVTKAYEIGISKKSYIYIGKVLSYRPFDNLPGLKYEYFFVPGISKNADNVACKTYFRVSQGKNAKIFEFELTNELFANLLWFFELKDFETARYLKEISLMPY